MEVSSEGEMLLESGFDTLEARSLSREPCARLHAKPRGVTRVTKKNHG